MSSNGLVGGYSDATFRPNQAVTRAEYTVFMARVIRFEREAAIRTQDWDKLISYMTVSEQVGQMLMPDIRQWNGKATTTVNEGLKRTIHDQDLGGLILFDKNIVDMTRLQRSHMKYKEKQMTFLYFLASTKKVALLSEYQAVRTCQVRWRLVQLEMQD